VVENDHGGDHPCSSGNRQTDEVLTVGQHGGRIETCESNRPHRHIREHDCDAEDYLAYVHDIDLGDLAADPGLKAALARLPGRRFVFTNGCANHAARILDRIGLADSFDAVWDIRSMGFSPKPMVEAYTQVMTAGAVEGPEAAMFDDIARNLVPARALGMTTVWLKTDAPWGRHGPLMDVAPGDIEHETDNLTQFLNTIRI